MTERLGGNRPPLWTRTPHDVTDWFDEAAIERSRRYVRPLRQVRRVSSVVDTLVLIAIIRLHAAPRLLHHFHVHNLLLGVVVSVAVVVVAGAIVAAPASAWVELSYDKKWDLSTQTAARWIGDQVKNTLVGIVILSLFLGLAYWAIRLTAWWWLWGAVAFMAIGLVIAFVYPVVIMPMFNKFTPLESGDLRARIDHIADLAGVSIRGSFTMDGSKRSRRDQAFVAGFGATKRVVVYDTMLSHPHHVIEQVVAHEIGHYRLRHITKRIPVLLALTAINFGVLELVLGWKWLLRFAGVTKLSDPGSLPLFLLAFTSVQFFTSVLDALLSRHDEREADLEALELLGDPGAMIDVWRRMAPKNMSDLEPTMLQRLKGSHPEVAERMAFARAWATVNHVDVRERAVEDMPA